MGVRKKSEHGLMGPCGVVVKVDFGVEGMHSEEICIGEKVWKEGGVIRFL